MACVLMSCLECKIDSGYVQGWTLSVILGIFRKNHVYAMVCLSTAKVVRLWIEVLQAFNWLHWFSVVV